MNTFGLIAAKVVLGGSLALGCLLTPHATAHADVYDREMTVNLTDLPDIDSMPVCREEDGSDVPAALLPCVWTNDGNAWLTYEDRSYLIVDDTVVSHDVAAADGGAPGPDMATDPGAYEGTAYVGGYN